MRGLDAISCTTGDLLFHANDTEGPLCPCDPTDAAKLTLMPDGAIKPDTYYCDDPSCTATGNEPDPEICDGQDMDGVAPFDEGCGEGEHCKEGDHDGAPVRFSSGRVETNPLTLFALPTPEGISLDYRIIWGSHVATIPAQARLVNGTQDPVPTIHHHEEQMHFIGRGWQDSFSDRLIISTRYKSPSTITWTSMKGTVTFSAETGWKSWSGKYELIDRGTSPTDGLGRWVVRTTDASGPRQIWAFEELSYTSYGGTPYVYKIGRLRRRSLLTSNLANLQGRYGYTITWSSSGSTSGLIQTVADTLGRELTFLYTISPPINGVIQTRTVKELRYRPGAGLPYQTVAVLQMDASNTLLDRVTRPGFAGYTRFVYGGQNFANCIRCGSMVTDVLVPGPSASSTPATQAPPLPSEIAIEHNDYAVNLIGVTSYKMLLGTGSRYPGREYAYEHRFDRSTQFDLHQDTGLCGQGAGCDPGSACRAADGRCYVARIITHDVQTRSQTAIGSSSGGSGGGETASLGSPGTHYTIPSPRGFPESITDAALVNTTYGFDSTGRIRCIVRNDDDAQAFASPTSPDNSACAGPADAQIIRVDYTSTTITKTTASVLSGDVTEVETLDSSTLLPLSTTRTGKTRDINGTQLTETHVMTRAYDVLGRVTEENGPLPDAVALDKTTISYYTTADFTWPHDFGRAFQVTRYVGTASANTSLTTTYAEYDREGIPHLVTYPDGQQLRYTDSNNRLTWILEHVATGATTRVTLNADGTVRSVQDPDGVCMSYEYIDEVGRFVAAPTKIKRSSACEFPINVNTGEVELRTYYQGESDRLKSIVRQRNGAVQFAFGGDPSSSNSYLQYDRDRRVIAAKTVNSAPFTFGFTDVLPSSTIGPDGPTPGSWRTDTAADELARPISLLRFLDASNKQTYTYNYASPTFAKGGAAVGVLKVDCDGERSPRPRRPDTCRKCTSLSARLAVGDIV